MKILVVDDEHKMGILVQGALQDAGHEVEVFTKSKDAQAAVRDRPFDLMVTDLKMPPPDGMALLKFVKENRPSMDVMMMTAYATAQTAVEAMQLGASDYLIKPFQLSELVLRVDKLSRARDLGENLRLLTQENALLKKGVSLTPRFGKLVGKSEAMQKVFDLGERVAQTEATVLIRGESGTGKSLLARAVHGASSRAQKPFVSVNCGAIPENLLESELFGHEKGAFTGAVTKKLGRFATANQGTLFLDEIGEMHPNLQVKLLQVLEEKIYYPVGSETPETADVRVITATNRILEDAIEEGEFRKDLFYRLNVFPIVIPPLAARKEDIVLFLEFFLARYGRTLDDVGSVLKKALLEYSYPGNVRELENMIERAIILAGSEMIQLDHFPTLSDPTGSPGAGKVFRVPDIPDEGLSIVELEKALILKALEKAGGNKTRAAKLLGLTRRTLYSRLERYGLNL